MPTKVSYYLLRQMRLVCGKPAEVGEVLTLVVIYLFGYFIDALASLTEPVLFRLMKGSPGERILGADYRGRIFVAQRAALNDFLQTRYPDHAADARWLFAVIASVANAKGSARLTEFQGAYVFARNILTALLIAEIIGLATHVT